MHQGTLEARSSCESGGMLPGTQWRPVDEFDCGASYDVRKI